MFHYVYLLTLYAVGMGVATAERSYSPYVGQEYPVGVFWGDTHLHTSNSVDAYYFGNRLGPSEAYLLAQGGIVTASNGMPVRLRKPLDFLVIADHAESIGLLSGLEAEDPLLLATEVGKQLLREFRKSEAKPPLSGGMLLSMSPLVKKVSSPGMTELIPEFESSAWRRVTAEADRHNIPGRFTAFIGYEWSSRSSEGNLHRVVIFKDDATRANQVMPFSSLQSEDPEALWAYMAEYEKRTGGEILAIPHNGNLSNGEMFALQDFSGRPLTRSYAERRTRWEPLYEVTQIKGDSEAHPFLSPTDEFADYETWNSWYGKDLPPGREWGDVERSIKEGEYARSALKRGLWLEAQIGANPFKFGLVGSTDAHTSLPAVEENNFWGKAPITNPGPDRSAAAMLTMTAPIAVVAEMRRQPETAVTARAWHMSSSGYAAVWSIANTREALFAAMKRRETYATTGPRITVRFFGGWNFAAEEALAPDLAAIGYRKGVPMGGQITSAQPGRAPSFLIRAVKDPDGANLDRVQVIKGWVDKVGQIQEVVYNVALADGRVEDESGKLPPVGSTVNVRSATYTNSIGDPELATVWTDPKFDPAEPAFYYLRVLEIPTPRWTAYDVKFFGAERASPDTPMVTQERAYTSPIWYAPNRH